MRSECQQNGSKTCLTGIAPTLIVASAHENVRYDFVSARRQKHVLALVIAHYGHTNFLQNSWQNAA